MARVWNTPIFAIATVYFILDGIFSYVTQPITVWLSKKKLLERVRRWVTSLGPYSSLALFAVPVIILEPVKPLSAYLIGTGHFFAGAVVFIVAEVLKLTVVERLFQLNKRKLLSIPLFAWGYGYWRRMMDFLESTRAWQASRRMIRRAVELVGAVRSRLRLYTTGLTRMSWHGLHLAVVLSLVCSSAGAAGLEWQRYAIPATGLTVDVPTAIFEDAGPTEGTAGRQFLTKDRRADLTVKSVPNPDNDTPAAFLNKMQPPARIQYRRVTPAFFAVSSIRNGRTWYNRCNRASGFMNCVLINYPAAEERQWDAVVTRISLSLSK